MWGYDRYGNRTSFTQNIGGNPASSNPSIDTNTNRFNINQGFAYDKNGNVISNIDPMTSQARTFLFNADNKQYEVKNAFGATTARYYYDGEGKRVKKKVYDPNNPSVVSEETIFVYSSGKLVAEYSTATPPTNPTVSYTTTDHLGTPRIITDQFGQVQSRRDFLPFGEEITINIGARSTALKYGTSDDKVRQKFTGYQKDTETSLDFAEARMYDNRFGRFTAVDPLLASGKSANPQTFNRFIYVGNNPIASTDPLGLEWWRVQNKKNKKDSIFWSTDTPVGEEGDTVNKWTEYVYKAEDGYWYSLDPNSDQSSRWWSKASAEWDNGYYSGFNGYGRIPVYNSLLTMISGIKTGNVERGILGFGELSFTFAAAPRTLGAFLKEGTREGITYFSGLPVTNPFKKGVSTEDIMQRAANYADAKRIRQGFDLNAVGGTKAHKYADDFIERVQKRFGDQGLDIKNTSWMNGASTRYGQKGSVRFDVIDKTTGTGYDFKFGDAKNWPALKSERVNQLLMHGPSTIKTVKEINPARQ